MSVRAKFVVNYVVPGVDGTADRICLGPVYSGSEENKAFFRATPSGMIEFWCLNRAASEQFIKGKEFYVDFTEAA